LKQLLGTAKLWPMQRFTNGYLRRERCLVGIFILMISLNLTHAVRAGWLDVCHGVCTVTFSAPAPTTAPEAYRIAIPVIQRLLWHVLPTQDATVGDALLDCFCCYGALFILYILATDKVPQEKERLAERIGVVGVLLAFFQFPIAFVVYQQRPETLPSALFLAVGLLCLVRAKNGWRWTVLLLSATALQTFVRSDVPFVFGAAIVLMSLKGNVLSDIGGRVSNFSHGLSVMLIAGSGQIYLQFIRYPHLPYSTGSPIMIKDNLRSDHLIVFLLALLPFLTVLALTVWSKRPIRGAESIAVAAAALYLPIWFTVGVVSEVRIFVPFLLLLCVVAARFIATYWSSDILAARDLQT
jgi:hypothetical protein